MNISECRTGAYRTQPSKRSYGARIERDGVPLQRGDE